MSSGRKYPRLKPGLICSPDGSCVRRRPYSQVNLSWRALCSDHNGELGKHSRIRLAMDSIGIKLTGWHVARRDHAVGLDRQ